MADITASMVKELREKSGAGMMDAKNALVENNGDMDAAIDWLRTKGLSKAEKKSSRTAAEGLVVFSTEGNKGAIVEVNAETDFVSRNEQFQSFVEKVGEVAKSAGESVEDLANAALDTGKSVKDTLTDTIATIGENMNLRRMRKLEVDNGVVVGYMHNAVKPGMGKIGVLVALESEGDKEKLEALGKQIAMHTAAAFPRFLSRDDVDQDVIDREKSVLVEQAMAEGKPEEIAQKMVEGRMRKFYEEICLLDQTFVIDGETKIADLVEKAEEDVGAPVKLVAYERFQLGEGIEKEEEDYAAEVAKAANG